MTDHPFALASTIAGTVTAVEYRGRRRLPGICTTAIDHLETELWRDLTRVGSLWSNIRLVHNGRDLHPSAFMTGRIGDGMIVHSSPDMTKVTSYLADGATLIYNHLNETSRAVQRVQETLEYQLNARVWIQAYLTRTSESAFGLHVDDHNFIVLQVFGRKQWHIDFDGSGDAEAFTLTPGEIVSVPSNTPHRVSGCGVLSLHLTIAFDWLDDTRTGSVIAATEFEAHRAAGRLGSAIPLALCEDIAALQLPFKFRDRVQPKVSRRDRGMLIECHEGRILLDHRFGDVVARLTDGAELTKAQMLQRNPELDENDLDKFLRFGVENQILHCSG